jgi:hypothetical protein
LLAVIVPGGSLLGGFGSLFGRFNSLFGRLGNLLDGLLEKQWLAGAVSPPIGRAIAVFPVFSRRLGKLGACIIGECCLA